MWIAMLAEWAERDMDLVRVGPIGAKISSKHAIAFRALNVIYSQAGISGWIRYPIGFEPARDEGHAISGAF